MDIGGAGRVRRCLLVYRKQEATFKLAHYRFGRFRNEAKRPGIGADTRPTIAKGDFMVQTRTRGTGNYYRHNWGLCMAPEFLFLRSTPREVDRIFKSPKAHVPADHIRTRD